MTIKGGVVAALTHFGFGGDGGGVEYFETKKETALEWETDSEPVKRPRRCTDCCIAESSSSKGNFMCVCVSPYQWCFYNSDARTKTKPKKKKREPYLFDWSENHYQRQIKRNTNHEEDES